MQDRSFENIDGTNGRIPIITYHSIDNSGSIVSTSPDTFRRQIAALSAEGYRSRTLAELAEDVQAGNWPDPKTVILTFDDGFENFYSEAAPVLSEYSFSATVFLVTSKCGEFNEWSGNPDNLPKSRLLSWDQIRELSDSGFEFGSHTMTHPELTTISPEASEIEIRQSRTVIEDAIGRPVVSFAYPFGRFTPSVRQLVEETYATACSTNLGRIKPGSDMHALERLDAYYLSNPRSLEHLGSRWMDGYFSFRQLLRNVRGSVTRNHSGAVSGAHYN
jgi:peptidoglycan/xylan/chitin deacetylase (PgdA/CDA1 family)